MNNSDDVLVSVVLPTYNRGSRCILAIKAELIDPWIQQLG